jgi:hypothetical protein
MTATNVAATRAKVVYLSGASRKGCSILMGSMVVKGDTDREITITAKLELEQMEIHILLLCVDTLP